jgi:hypothetical protein
VLVGKCLDHGRNSIAVQSHCQTVARQKSGVCPIGRHTGRCLPGIPHRGPASADYPSKSRSTYMPANSSMSEQRLVINLPVKYPRSNTYDRLSTGLQHSRVTDSNVPGAAVGLTTTGWQQWVETAVGANGAPNGCSDLYPRSRSCPFRRHGQRMLSEKYPKGSIHGVLRRGIASPRWI